MTPLQILQTRLADLQDRVADVQGEIDLYPDSISAADRAKFRTVHQAVGAATWTLLQTPPPTDLGPVQAQIASAEDSLADLEGTLGGAIRQAERRFQNLMAAWSILVLALAGAGAYFAYSATAAPHIGYWAVPKAAWPAVRITLLAGFGGMAGNGIVLSRILSHFGPARDLNPRLTQWNIISPFVCAALAGVFIFVIRLTALAFVGTTANGPTPVGTAGAASAFALGVLAGFAPDTIIFRIKAVIKALFGTSEISPPQISPPQIKMRSADTARVTVTVTPSDTTNITSANAVVQVPAGEASFILSNTHGNVYVGDITLPPRSAGPGGAAGGPAPGGTSASSDGSLTVEAWDASGNVARSAPVSLPPISASSGTGR